MHYAPMIGEENVALTSAGSLKYHNSIPVALFSAVMPFALIISTPLLIPSPLIAAVPGNV